MRFKPFVLFFIIILVTHAFAADPILIIIDQPELNVYADKCSYEAGDSGKIITEIKTYGMIEDTLIEVEVLTPEGKLVYGDILYTEVPIKTILNPTITQTEQVVYHENIDYVGPEKTITRTIPFEVPLDAAEGFYTLNVRMTTPKMKMEDSKNIYIIGGGEKVDLIMLLYIMTLILSLYLIWRD